MLGTVIRQRTNVMLISKYEKNGRTSRNILHRLLLLLLLSLLLVTIIVSRLPLIKKIYPVQW